MSPKKRPPAEPVTIAQYIAALIGTMGRAHPDSLVRMRNVVGRRRARIVLDDEPVDVWFGRAALRVKPADDHRRPDGEGTTDSATVIDLLDGHIEVADAILRGQLRVSGEAQDVIRMFVAIEILLDASPRTPALQALARKFELDRSHRAPPPAPARDEDPWHPFVPRPPEYELLSRLDLLPD